MAVEPADLIKIQNRTEEEEVRRLFDGCLSSGEHTRWDWENKYRLLFSVPIKKEELEHAYQFGMLQKSQLVDGKYYWGICRNARVALWSTKRQLFFYRRKKGDWFTESTPHPIDELVHADFWGPGRPVVCDTFLPWVEVEPLALEQVELDKG